MCGCIYVEWGITLDFDVSAIIVNVVAGELGIYCLKFRRDYSMRMHMRMRFDHSMLQYILIEFRNMNKLNYQ